MKTKKLSKNKILKTFEFLIMEAQVDAQEAQAYLEELELYLEQYKKTGKLDSTARIYIYDHIACEKGLL